METSSADESNDRLDTIVAVLIAVVTVLGALVAWRAAVADDQAGGADTAGLNAAINAEQTRALNHVVAYANYGSYTTYVQNIELGNLLAADLENTPEEEALNLERQAAEAADLAETSLGFFNARYLDRNGRYNIQRQLGEAWAEAAREKDLNPDPHFAAADQQRLKSSRLVAILSLLGVSLVFYTLVETVGARFKLSLLVGGTLLMIIAVVATFMVEWPR
jgi:hypothetical protein